MARLTLLVLALVAVIGTQHLVESAKFPTWPIKLGDKARDGLNWVHRRLGTGHAYDPAKHGPSRFGRSVTVGDEGRLVRQARRVTWKDVGMFAKCRTPYYLARPGKCRPYDLTV